MTARALALSLLLAQVGCQGGESTGPAAPPVPVDPPWSGPLSPTPRPGDEVVATVDGAPIYASEIATQMAAESQDARAALDALVARELLVAEARRRGYLEAPETREARRRERVRRFIEDDFARGFDGPEDIPAEAIARAWRHPMVQAHYDHPITRVIRYVRIPLTKTATPEQVEAGRVVAERISDHIAKVRPATGEDFAQELKAIPDAPASTHRQTVIPQSGLDPRFVAAALTLARQGDVARPVRTPWGWDVLFLESLIPERHASFAEAEPEIRQNRFEPERQAGFLRWAEALARKARIWRDDSWLARIEVASPLELR